MTAPIMSGEDFAETKRELMATLLHDGAVKKAPPGKPFKLASGGESDVYVDLRPVLSRPTALEYVAALFSSLANKHLGQRAMDGWHIAGPALGAAPLVYATMMHATSMCFGASLIRKEEKEHGGGGKIFGADFAGFPIVCVEDVSTTGKSLIRAIDSLCSPDRASEIALAMTVVDRGADLRLFAERGIEFISIFTLDDILKEM